MAVAALCARSTRQEGIEIQVVDHHAVLRADRSSPVLHVQTEARDVLAAQQAQGTGPSETVFAVPCGGWVPIRIASHALTLRLGTDSLAGCCVMTGPFVCGETRASVLGGGLRVLLARAQ